MTYKPEQVIYAIEHANPNGTASECLLIGLECFAAMRKAQKSETAEQLATVINRIGNLKPKRSNFAALAGLELFVGVILVLEKFARREAVARARMDPVKSYNYRCLNDCSVFHGKNYRFSSRVPVPLCPTCNGAELEVVGNGKG